MKIELDLYYYDAVAFRDWLRKAVPLAGNPIHQICDDVCLDIAFAIIDEDERWLGRAQNVNAETGGVDDSMEKQNTTSAGKGLR